MPYVVVGFLWAVLLFCTSTSVVSAAGTDGWREKLIFCDDRYDTPWANPQAAAAFLQPRGFRVVDADELGRWMADATERKQAADTLVVLPHGLCPIRLLDIDEKTRQFSGAPGSQTLIRRYMEAGGRVIWSGEMPFYYAQGPQGALFYTGTAFPTLGNISRDPLDLVADILSAVPVAGNPTITPEGKQWGLGSVYGNKGIMKKETVSVSLCDGPGANTSVIFFKNFNTAFPWSGLVCSAITLTQDDLYRLALYRGTTLAVPRVEEAPKAVPATELTVSIQGKTPGVPRTAFLRGETL
ncbi:MAG TPA: hypothetical protein VGM23_05625, partial [Armatimonadota bacterium]